MILNFLPIILNLKYSCCILFLLTIVFKKYSEVYIAYDVTTRLDLNLFFLDLLHFSWTNISYIFTIQLPLIILTYILIISYKISFSRYIFIALNVIITVVYFIYTNNLFLTTNYPTLKLDYYNSLLFNGLNKYHPFILYATWVLVFIQILNFSRLTTNSIFCHRMTGDAKYLLAAIRYIILTLTMGSWWAYQEGSWGGWWNWDPSEVFGLYIMLIISFYIHLLLVSNSYFFKKFILSLIFLLSLAYYSFMQINFSLISHNFGFRDSDLIDIRLFYFIIFILLFMITIYLYRKLSNSMHYLIYNNIHTNYIWYKLLFSFQAVFIISVSLFILLNDLSWKIFKLNIINISTNYSALIIFIFMIYYILNFNFNLYYILIYLLFTLYSYNFILLTLIIYLITSSSYSNIHLLILLSIFYTFIFTKFYITTWSCIKFYSSLYSINISYLDDLSFSIRYPFLGESFKASTSEIYTNYLSSTSPDIKLFNLNLSYNSTTQSLAADHDLVTYLFSSYDKNTVCILTCLILFLILLSFIKRNVKLILI